MALITCNECGREVSSSAPACPHCGKVRKRPGGCLELIAGAIIVVIAIAVFMHFAS